MEIEHKDNMINFTMFGNMCFARINCITFIMAKLYISIKMFSQKHNFF